MSGIGLSIAASQNLLGFFSQPQEQFFIQQLKKITLQLYALVVVFCNVRHFPATFRRLSHNTDNDSSKFHQNHQNFCSLKKWFPLQLDSLIGSSLNIAGRILAAFQEIIGLIFIFISLNLGLLAVIVEDANVCFMTLVNIGCPKKSYSIKVKQKVHRLKKMTQQRAENLVHD